jgi:hypothetical protein
MRTLLSQIETSLNAQLYYLSLFGALSIPDIGGALDSDDGGATGQKYAEWYDKWARPRFVDTLRAARPDMLPYLTTLPENPMTGDACYRFRCSLLHQGSSQHPKSPFDRIVFVEPHTANVILHYNILNRTLTIDLKAFCLEIVAGARVWLDSVEASARYLANYSKFARRRPEGLPPLIVNLPVVG